MRLFLFVIWHAAWLFMAAKFAWSNFDKGTWQGYVGFVLALAVSLYSLMKVEKALWVPEPPFKNKVEFKDQD